MSFEERNLIELPQLTGDGRLYHNAFLNRVEALIPNPYVSCHAADLLELPNGDLLCCWFAGSSEGNADISIALSRLNRGSDRWEEPQIISDDPTRSEQNPSLFLAPGGDIWVMYTAQLSRTPETDPNLSLQYTAEIRRRISHDNGHTWGETSVMFNEPGSFCRQKIQVLSNGRWIFGGWMCHCDDSRNGSDTTVLRISDDQGKTWRRVDMPGSRGRVHANIVELGAGKLLCLMRSRSADNIYRSVSEDNGETWSVPERTELPNNNAGISAIRLREIAAAAGTDTAAESGIPAGMGPAVAILYNSVRFNDDASRTVWPEQRCPIAAAISEDGGRTWPWKRLVETGEGYFGAYNDINNRRYGYPVMMQSSDGTILAAYTFGNRSFIKFTAFDEGWIRGEKLCRGAEGSGHITSYKKEEFIMEKWTRAKYQPSVPMGKDGTRITASKEHITLSKEAAKEGMVLLKNEKNTLPMRKGTKIALFGKGTIDYVKGGGGSGDVTVPYIRNLAQGFEVLSDMVSVFPDSVAFYEAEVKKQYEAGRAPGMVEEPELPEALVKKAASFTDTAVISISRFSGEGWDRKCTADKHETHKGTEHHHFIGEMDELFERGDFYLSAKEEAMVNRVTAAFDRVIVVLNVGGMVDTSWFSGNDRIQAVLYAWQGGMEGGLAAAELLMGQGNPSGKLADTLAQRLEDYPSAYSFYDSDDYVEYLEDIYVGYRYFETIPGMSGKVVYPFGFGLSYTEFAVENQKIGFEARKVRACADVTNLGRYAGKETLQLYVALPQGKLGKPAKTLIGYRKTELLAPGQTQRVVIDADLAEFASYDDLGKVAESAYVLEKGEYRFFLGTSVRDVTECEECLVLDRDEVVEQLSRRMAPSQLPKRLLSDGTYEELPQTEPHVRNCNPQMMRDGNGMAPNPLVRGEDRIPRQPDPDQPTLIKVYNGEMTLKDFIAELSDEDLAHLCGGQPNTGVANTYGVGNNSRFGIPNIMTADGPAGVRVKPETGVTTTAFPCATLLACTWNPRLVTEVGRAGGLEARENNLQMWLTPALNIHRTPLCGRNFEYYSEDPFLAGKQAGAMVRGIQSTGTAATVKHFALNNKETNRKNSDSRASERAIREIYLKAFEHIVKEAKPWALMTSYNTINGYRASENADLLKGILRGEWGFDGMVTTDWWTTGEHAVELKAGNDLKMGCGYPELLMEALKNGEIDRADMELAAEHILGLILRVD